MNESFSSKCWRLWCLFKSLPRRYRKWQQDRMFMRGYNYAMRLLSADSSNHQALKLEAHTWRMHQKYDSYAQGIIEALYDWSIYGGRIRPMEGK